MFMTRSTKRQIMVRVSRIEPIPTSPLNAFMATTVIAFRRNALNSPQPVMQSSVTNALSLPCVMFSPLRHLSVNRGLMAWLKAIWHTEFFDLLNSPLFAGFKRTWFRAIMMFRPVVPARQSVINLLATFTGSSHKQIIAEMQVSCER